MVDSQVKVVRRLLRNRGFKAFNVSLLKVRGINIPFIKFRLLEEALKFSQELKAFNGMIQPFTGMLSEKRFILDSRRLPDYSMVLKSNRREVK